MARKVTPGDESSASESELWDRLRALPTMDDDPLQWDRRSGTFVSRKTTGDNHQTPSVGAPGTRRSSVVPPPGATPVEPPMMSHPASRPIARPANTPTGRPTSAGRPRKRRRSRVKVAVAILIVGPLVVVVGALALASAKFSQIPRAQVSGAFTPAIGGTNYLIVGTDSREGIKASDPNAGAFLGTNVAGSRTDTIMVLHIENGRQSLLSIPRDLWVKDPSTGQMGRINSTFTSGPTNLIKAVESIGIPIQHYAEINFVSFGKLVDSAGGIDINFAFPSRDTNSGLNIATAGPNHLNGTAALAYVRSRYFEELKNGKWVTDPRSDLGRIDRQRQFLTALTNNVTNTANPLTLSNMADAMSAGLKIDDALNLLDALKLGWSMRSFHPISASLPVTPRTTNGGADVLDLKQPDAKTMMNQFNHDALPNPPTAN